jgi:metal-dependent amidase/aminoacylase/carboxypeptidase family protein
MADLQDRVRRLATNLAEAQGCTAQVDFLLHVPAVNNRPEWVQAALPTLERVVAHDHLVETAPTLGYDNVSVFVNRYGGLYVVLGCPRDGPPMCGRSPRRPVGPCRVRASCSPPSRPLEGAVLRGVGLSEVDVRCLGEQHRGEGGCQDAV